MKQRKIARIVLALAVVLALTMTELTPFSMVQEASAVTQADIDKLKDELSGMNSEKAQLEKELKSIQNNKNTALAQKENIDKQINLLQSEIRNVESLISEYETLIEQTEQEIRENEEEEKRQYEKFCARVRSMEERGTVSYWSVLFNAASFTDLLSAMDFISEIMDSDQKVIDDLRALREQIEQKKATLEASLAEQQTAKETLVTKKNELNTQRAAAEKAGDIVPAFSRLSDNEYIGRVAINRIDLGTGCAEVDAQAADGLFYTVLGESSGFEINGEADLFRLMGELSAVKRKYDRIAEALGDAEEKGYGIVMPGVSELKLEEPQTVRQAGGFAVKLRASAESIHMIRAGIEAEINPIVGSEQQAEELIKYLRQEMESAPGAVWQSNMFGRSLYDLINDGLRSKLEHIPEDARQKLSETLERIINEGSGGLICILL